MANKKSAKKNVVMSLGGSLISPDEINVAFLKKFKKIIINHAAKGNTVIIICGGGNPARAFQKAAKQITPSVSHRDLDWVGIGATMLNAQLVSAMFGDLAHESIIFDPHKKVKTSRRIIVGAGYQPGCSSDLDAVLIAKAYGIDTVINLSNISYIYDKDPNKFTDAKAYETMTWPQMRKLVGNTWVPGAHVPFDPIATKLAQKTNKKLIVMLGNDLANLQNFLSDKSFKGTVVE